MKASAMRFISSLIVLLALSPLSYSQTKPPSREELLNALQKRVGQFHSALSARDFQGAWDFLGPGLKKDNPKEQYIERLKAKIGKWELASNPDISFSGKTTKKTNRPIGEVFSKVNVRTPDGLLVPIMQQTTWLWLDGRGSEPAWYVAQESIQEFGPEQRPLGLRVPSTEEVRTTQP